MVSVLLLYHSTKLKTKHVPKEHPVRVWNRMLFYYAYELLTSIQLGQKWDSELLTNLVESLLFYSRQLVGKLF